MEKELEKVYEEEIARREAALKNHLKRFDKTDDTLKRQAEINYVIREAGDIFIRLSRIRELQESLEESA